jgi:EAL domain-containing protein (putative c-di-GMP-specific phosphodiesterase class I)
MTDSSPPLAANALADAPNSSSEWIVPRDSYRAMRDLVGPEHLGVVFQPIVAMQSGKLFAHEALVRCRLPRFASPPDLFVHAVANGCCGRLGRMIRDIAIPLCSGLPVFLNVHPQELNESWIVRPDDPIFAHDHDVYLEITESVPLTHFALCLDILNELRSRGGVFLVVDDLGAGYSNLKRIADLNPQVVKLDRDLIAGIDKNPRQQQLVRSVVRLCADLNARVVAEGIETSAEFSALLDTGVDYGQGYLFARPSYPIPAFHWPEHEADAATSRRLAESTPPSA